MAPVQMIVGKTGWLARIGFPQRTFFRHALRTSNQSGPHPDEFGQDADGDFFGRLGADGEPNR